MSDDRRIVDDPFDDGPRPRESAPPRRTEPDADIGYSDEKPPEEESVVVPADALAADTLTALIEEYVTRHGTDLTDAGDKVVQVRKLLEVGKVQIVFDPNTESCNIVSVK
ncbi:MAG TPA: YheU family protein [Tepidisphaeraceae bacterium]|nr:YheU family protein [Tepidisphaeraceae bacterium]